MTQTKRIAVAALLAFSGLIAFAEPARALTLTGFGGTYIGSNESGMYGGEVTFKALALDLGGFYESSKGSNALSYGVSRQFFGIVGRLPLASAFFLDARAGFHQDTDTYNTTLSGIYIEGGAGYSFGIVPGLLDIQPRLGFNFLAANTTYPFLNGSVMASLRF